MPRRRMNMKNKTKKVIVDKVIGFKIIDNEYTVNVRDAVIYALGII